MIYLVSNNLELFNDSRYERISPDGALNKLFAIKKTYKNKRVVGGDTETQGLDVFTKKILTIQLGTYDFQIVWDCTSYPIFMLKEFLEHEDTLSIWWNYLFDGKFLFHHGIYPKHVYDGFVAERLLFLGFPPGTHSLSLKSAGYNYCGVELDKTVRGQIITKGLTPNVIVYAADDVKYEVPIFEKQLQALEEKDLLKAVEFENEFLKVLIYIEYCGVHLDIKRWKAKMKKDREALDTALSELNNWVINYFHEHRGDLTSMTIERDNLIDTQFEHDAKKLKQLGYIKKDRDNKSTKFFTKHSGDPNVGLLYYQTVREKFPYLKMDLQGDLWSGFKTEPDCVINWASSRQLIPFLEMLGFNLETFDKVTKLTKKSTDVNTIKANMSVSSITPILLRYKKAQKVVDSFGQNFIDAVNPVTGRIHADFHSIGTDTARLSCGGGEAKVNVQQLPHDAETRACFNAEKGNKWISADYQSQESRIIASVANDEAMIDLFINGCGDVHSLVAKMSYPSIIGDCPVELIKKKYPEYRQEAKGIEFAVAPTLEYFSKNLR